MNRQRFVTNVSYDLIKYTCQWDISRLPELVHLVCELVEIYGRNFHRKELALEIIKIVMQRMENIPDKEAVMSLMEPMLEQIILVSTGDSELNLPKSLWGKLKRRVLRFMKRGNPRQYIDLASLLSPAFSVSMMLL